jgi:hypothetical protein
MCVKTNKSPHLFLKFGDFEKPHSVMTKERWNAFLIYSVKGYSSFRIDYPVFRIRDPVLF